jgi:uncharacterized protein YcfL
MQTPALMFLLIMFFTLAGCSQSDDDGASNSVIIETQMETLNKAENVENVLKQADEQQRDSIDNY